MSHEDKELSLTGLSPDLDPERWEGLVGRINASASTLLAARRREASALTLLSAWRRPVLTGALALTAAAVTALMMVPEPETPQGGGIAVAEGVMPGSVAAWIDADVALSMEELIVDVEDYIR